MHFGLNFGTTLYEYSPKEQLAIALKAEECGFDSIWAGDHLIVPKVIPPREMTNLDLPVRKVDPRSPTARPVFEADAPMPDIFMVFAFLAAVTSRISFGSAVYILPVRHPIVSARGIGTLDVLSGGRTYFGVGAGWLPDEFEIAGEDFGTRGRRMDECVRIIRELWEKEEPAYEGEFYSFPAARFEPKPVQKPGPPILVGGDSEPALNRAAKLGDGWCGRTNTPAKLRERAEGLTALRRRYGRKTIPFIIQSWMKPNDTADHARALQDAGATQLLVGMHAMKDFTKLCDEIERFSESVINRL